MEPRDGEMKRRVGLTVPVTDDETDYRPTVTLRRMSERDRRGATVKRAEGCGAGESDGWKDAELGVENESKQDHKEEASGGDLLPEVDRADSLWSRPGDAAGLLWTGTRGRTGEEEPEEPAERTGVTMIMRVRDEQKERDNEQDDGRYPTTPLGYPHTTSWKLHVAIPQDLPGERGR